MLGESHDLLHDFPEYADHIAEMREHNGEFRASMEEYNWLDAQVRNLEEHDQPVSDTHMEELKRRRVYLKDRLYQMLSSQQQ
ncbi:MAG: hypothetical protein DHS20C01_10050 [marine bacterium B5-7]|nr:MAG: hypothetical protein DHS20C01_10050 [marine bacterium B5-7]